MDVTIKEKKENKLLSRIELILELSFFGKVTPRKEEIQKIISDKEKAKPELVVVERIYTKFGSSSAKAVIHIYPSEEQKKKVLGEKKEKKVKEKKDQAQEDKKE